MAAYTVETWLRGMVDFDLTQETLAAILFNRNIPAGSLLHPGRARESRSRSVYFVFIVYSIFWHLTLHP